MEYRYDAIEHVRPASEEERQLAKRAIDALSRPRLTGSPGADETAATLRRHFEEAGYEIDELLFTFSTWPGRFGLPMTGALYLAVTAITVAYLLQGEGWSALATLLAGFALFVFGTSSYRIAIARLPWARVETANWLVRRPGARPRYVVVAHRDSKSQPSSTYLRIAATAIAPFALAVLLVLAFAATLNEAWQWPNVAIAAGAIGFPAGLLFLLCPAQNDSPGALDNASGLAALLAIARREAEHDDVAFLITDGEELGLAGATAVATRLPVVLGIINLDGLDDEGDFHVVERFGWPRRGLAPHLAASLLHAADQLGLPAVRRDLMTGVMVDHVPLVLAGHPAITLMRGSAKSLRRVHRPSDSPDRLTGQGAADAAALVSGALHLLRRPSSSLS